MFKNCPSWLPHQAKEYSHAIGSMDNLINKHNFLVPSVHEDTLMDVPNPNITTHLLFLQTQIMEVTWMI